MDVFSTDARWIRSHFITNDRQKLLYSRPNCTIVSSNTNVTLDITNSSGIVFDGVQLYNSQYTSFDIGNILSPHSSYDYTLQVIGLSNSIAPYTGSIPPVMVTTTGSTSIASTTTISISAITNGGINVIDALSA